MILEEVQRHQYRDDIYINKIITPYDLVKKKDKNIINRILFEELILIE